MTDPVYGAATGPVLPGRRRPGGRPRPLLPPADAGPDPGVDPEAADRRRRPGPDRPGHPASPPTSGPAAPPAADGAVRRPLAGRRRRPPARHRRVRLRRRLPRPAPAGRPPSRHLADRVVAAGVRRCRAASWATTAATTASAWSRAGTPRYIANFDVGPLSALAVNEASPRQPAGGRTLSAGPRGRRRAGRPAAGPGGHRRRAPAAAGAPAGAPPGRRRSTRRRSARWCARSCENSDNMAAELLVKELGAESGVRGTTAAGLAVIDERLRQLGRRVPEGVRRRRRLGPGPQRQGHLPAAPAGPGHRRPPRARPRPPRRRPQRHPLPAVPRHAGRRAASGPRRGRWRGWPASTGLATGAERAHRRLLPHCANDLPSRRPARPPGRLVNVLAAYPRAPAPDVGADTGRR